jgi:hypothetical protein
VKNLDIYDAAEWVDRIAFVWIRLHLLWLGENEDQLPATRELDPVIDEAWSQLCDALRSMHSTPISSPWLKASLPLLTAPEYGISEQRQTQLLKALRGTDAEPEPLPEWYDSRQKALREAKRFQRGQAPEDLCEIFTDYQDNAVPEEDRITTLRREISEVFPNSPWADRETLETAIEQTRERRP